MSRACVMDWIARALSFTGRASRLSFWRWILLTNVLAAGLFVLAILLTMSGVYGLLWIAAAALFGIVPLVCPLLAAATRRLHDRDKSAWWLLVFCGLPFVLNVAAQSEMGLGGPWVLLGLVMALASLALTLWSWVELGFLRGTRGPNRFGPEPSRT